jgi:hypothetical protein
VHVWTRGLPVADGTPISSDVKLLAKPELITSSQTDPYKKRDEGFLLREVLLALWDL